MVQVIEGEHLNACLSQNGKGRIQTAGRAGVMEILDSTHNIISVGQEVIPEHLKGHTLIIYLPERDAIAIAGWKENTALIAELIANHLELTPSQHEDAMNQMVELGKQKEWYYLENGRFESGIILDGAGNLIDGYTTYLLAVKYGIEHVPISYGRRQVITGAHRPGGKLYVWELPGNLVDRVHIGDKGFNGS